MMNKEKPAFHSSFIIHHSSLNSIMSTELQTPARAAEVRRRTKETDVRVRLGLDGTGQASVSTGVAFLDHMLELFAKHGLFDLEVECRGDLHIDDHHSVEDVAISL